MSDTDWTDLHLRLNDLPDEYKDKVVHFLTGSLEEIVNVSPGWREFASELRAVVARAIEYGEFHRDINQIENNATSAWPDFITEQNLSLFEDIEEETGGMMG